ncbi:MAG: hypothetical protein OHK0039_12620 [Bacteroidia bacterium]
MLHNQLLQAQPYEVSNRIPVKNTQGQTLENPWAGGMNTPQFSDIDLNRDGLRDLVIFNRDDYSFQTYLNAGKPGTINYIYAPRYERLFDQCECVEWALFEDYNCDGIEDLFCGKISGSNFMVYETILIGTDSLELVLRYDPVETQSGANLLWMYQVRTDMPSLVDVDSDGDLDVITSTNFFNWFVLHRNRSMEYYGRCDTLVMFSEAGCWADFLESNQSNMVMYSDTQEVCSRSSEPGSGNGGSTRHVGSTTLTTDFNKDGLVDMMVGDVGYYSATVLFNGGIQDTADMHHVEYLYPHTDSLLNVAIFPAFFYVDVDNDGVRDLIAAPNDYTDNLTANVNEVVLYLNKGLDDSVDFRFQGRSFLVTDDIDGGSFSTPTFFDHNGDGLEDILLATDFAAYNANDTSIANLTTRTYQLHLYENQGTLEAPLFVLTDTNYLNISQFPVPIKDPAPVAGDLDGDGDDDLLIGNINGTLLYYINIALPGTPAQFVPAPGVVLKDATQQVIDAGSVSAPELYDIDGDQDLDLFIGNQLGRIVFYRNMGTPTQAIFSLETPQWGDIKLSNESGSFFSGFAKPRLADYDGDGVVELLVGEETGVVEIYEDLHLAATDSLVKVGDLLDKDFGAFAAPAIATIDTTGRPIIIVGNRRGGLHLVSRPLGTSDTTTTAIRGPRLRPQLQLYPNPATETVQVGRNLLPSGQPGEIRLYDSMGRLVVVQPYRDGLLNVQPYPSGWYFVELRSGTLRATAQLRIQR